MTKNDDAVSLNSMIDLCKHLTFGRKTDENALFTLTREDVAPKNFARLAEAFDMMLSRSRHDNVTGAHSSAN